MGPQAVNLLGFPVEDWYDPSFWTDHIHPDDRSTVISTCTRLSAGGGNYEFDYRMVRSDGGVIWVHDIVSVEMGDAGPSTLNGFLVDITQRKALARAVEEKEERLTRLVQSVPDALLLIDSDGTIVQCNRQAGELFGVPDDELTGSAVETLIPERLAGAHLGHREAFARDPTVRPMGLGLDLVARRHDGSEVPVEISLSPIQRDGRTQVIASIRDISDRKRIELELRESERQLRLMANVLPAMIGFIDLDQRYRYVNDNYAEWIGMDQAQIVDRTVREVLGKKLYTRLRVGIEAALRGEPVNYETELPSLDGSTMPVELSLIPQFEEAGVVSGYFVVVFDITDRVRSLRADRVHREDLAHFSRVATMGELSSSIAHELNQPLAAVVANAQAASRFLAAIPPNLGEVDDALGDIAEDAKRAGKVIRHMRNLLRRGGPSEEPIDVDLLVAETVEMLHSDAIARHVSVVVDSAGDLPSLSGDPIQLKQVMLNLAVNAFDAMSETDTDQRVLVISTSSSDGRVEIRFSDNGAGLPDVLEMDVFAPFVSSKPEGMGMGLSISRTIVEAHGGQLLAENNADGGATLRVFLPVTSGEEE